MKTTSPAPNQTIRIEPAGFFALRTPLLPFDELRAFGDGLRAPTASPPELDAALSADREELRRRLRAVVARPDVREALFVASPSLDESLASWLEAPESERGQKVERTLMRYFVRMAARPTPFGLFAGCSVGTLGERTRLVLPERDRYRRHTRLDGDYLVALTDALQREPDLRRALAYRANGTLHRIGGRWRYIEERLTSPERARIFRLVDLEPSPELDATLARAGAGATLVSLAEAIVGEAGGEVTLDEAMEFAHQLVDAQILVSDLTPQVTGAEPIDDLVAQLSTAAPAVAATLGDVRRALAELDASPLGAAPACYRTTAERLAALPAEAELARLFQVDLVKPAPDATLGPEPVAELVRAVGLLSRVARRRSDSALDRFRAAFEQRYEGRAVPLVEALDEDLGIGFERADGATSDTSPLLEGLELRQRGKEPSLPLDAVGRMLLVKLQQATRAGADEIVLEEADLVAVAAAEPLPLPASLSALVTLAAPSADAFAQGDFRLWLHMLNGPSGANLLGRFCHGDEELTARVRAHLRAEEAERPDAIYAEVVHLPEGRTGNILLRPLLRDHEICFLGRSGAPPERQIHLDDLLVSVENGRIVLRSRRLAREIIPRLTTAHAFFYRRNLGVYRFLCALQAQDGETSRFDWGPLEAIEHLPRVRLGRVILRARRWRLRGDEVAPFADDKTAAARFTRMRALMHQHGLPRWVAVTDGDHVLPLDLDNSLAVDTFAQMVKERPMVLLSEMPAHDQLCAHGPEGRFSNELVVPLLARATTPAPRVSGVARTSQLARSFPPGSEWWYAKLYCGEGTADHLLREVVAPLVARLRDDGIIDHWFFIRYADPDFHLRLRFHGAADVLEREAVWRIDRALGEPLSSGLAWKLQHDTYQRELERYGGDHGMPLAERIFGYDSDAVLTILASLEGAAAADQRWRLALRGIDQLLDDLSLTLDEKHALMERVRLGFGSELGAGATTDRQLGERFRRERLALEKLLDRAHDAGSELEPGLAALATRSSAIAPLGAALRAHADAGRLDVSLIDLGGSLIHMHANRLLRGAARQQELVLYDFLLRLYQGRRARQKRRS